MPLLIGPSPRLELTVNASGDIYEMSFSDASPNGEPLECGPSSGLGSNSLEHPRQGGRWGEGMGCGGMYIFSLLKRNAAEQQSHWRPNGREHRARGLSFRFW